MAERSLVANSNMVTDLNAYGDQEYIENCEDLCQECQDSEQTDRLLLGLQYKKVIV